MIKSMTGFGRAQTETQGKKITVELKSVNHRYLELSVKAPKKLGFLESRIRSYLKGRLSRGKIDVYISYENDTDAAQSVKYNEQIASEYLTHLRRMSQQLMLDDDIRISHLSRFPEVFTMEESAEDEDQIWSDLFPVLEAAADRFIDARVLEGAALKEDLRQKLLRMQKNLQKLNDRAPEIVSEYRGRLTEKVSELLADVQIDESRLATEIVLYADKICTDEERVRLANHIQTMLSCIDASEEVGRKMDFIAQEMNREANTILSKSNDLETSNIAIELKTDIEKIREQIQNIE